LTRTSRAPAWLYAHNLGWLLGRRFLHLAHRGRHSGRRYVTVLEVVAADRSSREFTVVSGFGQRSDWLRNVEAGGLIEVTVRSEAFAADDRRLEVNEAVSVLENYERRNRWIGPVVRRELSWLAGGRYDSSPRGPSPAGGAVTGGHLFRAQTRRRLTGRVARVGLDRSLFVASTLCA
jgi:deazaflavin-dependent oxidoreductase (nitroreductase family)